MLIEMMARDQGAVIHSRAALEKRDAMVFASPEERHGTICLCVSEEPTFPFDGVSSGTAQSFLPGACRGEGGWL